MACIKSAQRAALTALAPDAPYLAAGTMSGAVDMSFSASANIEIFRLDFQSDSPDLPLLASAPSPDRFNRLSWSKPGAVEGDSFALGLLAGGLSDGSVAVWNPLSLISSEGTAEDAMVARLERHTGPVCGLEFSELTPNRLASGAEQGELCIWDLKNPAEPVVFPPLRSVGSSAQAEISCLSWNPKFQHILATTSSNGMTVVWDLRNQKPLTSFSDSNKRKCSVLQWNPDHSTQLIVASDDDNSPSLRVWDVRKTISPVREFVGHSKGVIAMSWCPYDSSFLLTCSKDNRTICWDTVSGEIISELPTSVNGNFDLHWYRKIPGVIAASSFDGKIGIYNIEFSGLYAAGDALGAPARPRAPAPKWLKCPTGASFGFGGKLVSFHPVAPPIQGAQASSSEVQLHNLVIEQSLVSRSTEFETAIQNGDKSSLRALCEKKSQESLTNEERETWGFLRVMFEDGDVARTKLLAHLGFEPPQAPTANSTDELSQTLADTLNLDHGTITDNTDAQFLVDNGDDFFNNPQSSEASLAEESTSTNGQQIEHEMPADVVPSDPTVDKSIQHALVVGDYKGAVNQCLAANRMADALVIAHAGGSALWESTRNHYLKNSISPYLKVVSAMVGNDLTSFVSTWPLSSWKETLALLCTFARKEEWTVLCDMLASRLLSVDTLAATLCYICAGNIDKTVEIWSRTLKSEDGGKAYVDLLQDLMEKTITLALATGHKRFSASLSKLVENYAELLASQGLLKTAMEYLKLLGSDEHSHELAILRDRIACSTEENDNASSVSQSTGTHSPYVTNQSPYVTPDHSQNLYQQVPQQYNMPNNTYPEVYQPQPPAAYGYSNTYQPQPPTQMFVPPSTPASSQQQQGSAPVPVPPQTVKTFTPANPAGLKNPEQYQQPNTLGSQLYTGAANQPYSSGPSASFPSGPPTTFHQPSPVQYHTAPPVPSLGPSAPVPGTVPNQMFPHPVATNSTPRFMPSNNQSFAQRPGLSPVQPSSPTQVQAQPAPPAPPPTVQTADTSKVSAELRPVIATLTKLFDETSKALGGSQATQAKKREIEDNSRKIGALFAKLNSGDISPNVSSKLIQLCSALDSSDFATAMHLQVLLTTSDWDECNFWLAALKRMIKTRQNFRM